MDKKYTVSQDSGLQFAPMEHLSLPGSNDRSDSHQNNSLLLETSVERHRNYTSTRLSKLHSIDRESKVISGRLRFDSESNGSDAGDMGMHQ